ncbi:MAG: GNAT family N-acetyltransferase [Acetivibrio sp.]
MKARKAEIEDLPDIMKIIDEAKEYLKLQGVDQWQDGTPNEDIISKDIARKESFVFTEENKICAYAVLSVEKEDCYDKVYDGNWKGKDSEYAVIHRTAMGKSCRGRGKAQELFDICEQEAKQKGRKTLRIDTHQDNRLMQHLIKKNGFTHCGWIYMKDGVARQRKVVRLAYEKRI